MIADLSFWQWVGVLFAVGCFAVLIFAIIYVLLKEPMAVVISGLIGAMLGFLAFCVMFTIYTFTPGGSWSHFFIATGKWGPYQLPSFITWPAIGAFLSIGLMIFMVQPWMSEEERGAEREAREKQLRDEQEQSRWGGGD